jgi:hypothetical protein
MRSGYTVSHVLGGIRSMIVPQKPTSRTIEAALLDGDVCREGDFLLTEA